MMRLFRPCKTTLMFIIRDKTSIKKRDEEALKYLKDIKWCRMDDPKEVRATGSNLLIPGGLVAQAQSTATLNTSTRNEDKVTLSKVLTDATIKLPAGVAAMREDVDGLFNTMRQNNPNSTAHPTRVATFIEAATIE
nr:hypothetical protein [Tanacetum cinerariifolium]